MTKQFCAILTGVILATFGGTYTYLSALMLAFGFNIIAGLQADNVGFQMKRFANFKGRKLKDSLKELLLITVVTYAIKALIVLMNYENHSIYAVEIMIWIAIYYYVTNSLRNLNKAFPNVKWVKVIYHIVSFQFGKMMPDFVNQAIKKTEEEEKQKNKEI